MIDIPFINSFLLAIGAILVLWAFVIREDADDRFRWWAIPVGVAAFLTGLIA